MSRIRPGRRANNRSVSKPDLMTQWKIVKLGKDKFRVDRYLVTPDRKWWLLWAKGKEMDFSGSRTIRPLRQKHANDRSVSK